jgi:erythronate-4-phosphate dehydrogenase
MIVAIDEAIPYWQQAFSGLGDIRPFRGRNLRAVDVRDADAIIVRSVSPVGAALLEGSCVRFVGTATIGMDHLDQEYLQSRQIYFTNAAGSNANAVSEWVITALLTVATRKGWDLARKCCAVIGVGQVGSRVESKLRSLGMPVLLCDPPLRDATANTKYQLLPNVLEAEILTLHVPLTRQGPYPTYHMIDHKLIERLSPGTLIVNSARGSVVETGAFKQALQTGRLTGAVLDVWEGEPSIDYELMELVDIATPHIAGFSLDGKIRATEMILDEFCRFFDLQRNWKTGGIFPSAATVRAPQNPAIDETLRSVTLQAYNILRDDNNLRSLRLLPEPQAASCFDQLRNHYPFRPEFQHFMVELPAEDWHLATICQAMGFQTSITSNAGRSD